MSAPVRYPQSVATLLTPAERQRVDAAGEGCYVTLHRESIDELLSDVREQRASAVLVSVARYNNRDAPQVARLVREFPRVPAVALISASEPVATHAVLALGQHGVRSLVDARDPRGWGHLRQLISSRHTQTIEHLAIMKLRADLQGAPNDCLRFFEALFLAAPRVTTIGQLARGLGVLPSTFMSRFFRSGLPAPKRYLSMARLVRVARMFENPGMSIAQVANRMEYSSPQSFSRHVHVLLDMTPLDLRRTFNGEGLLDHMRDTLVLPYRETLQHFYPFSTPPHWYIRSSRSFTEQAN